MTGSPVLALVVICALAAAACSSSGSATDPEKFRRQVADYRDHERELVRETVADAGRAERLITLLDERGAAIEQYARAVTDYREAMTKLNADYRAERADFVRLIENYNREREIGHRRFLDLLAAMREETTAEEWKVVARFQAKRLNPRDLAYSQNREAS